jgi:hypothetical protein
VSSVMERLGLGCLQLWTVPTQSTWIPLVV